MLSKENLDQYIVKQVIVEVKYEINLLYSRDARKILDQFVTDFDIVNILGSDDTFEFINNEKYCTLITAPNRFGMHIENSIDIETSENILKTYLPAISKGLGRKSYTRFGTRVIYLFPFKDKFDNLVDICKSIFLHNSNPFLVIGKITDIGMHLLTLEDSGYKINLSFGPMQKKEIKAKIAKFNKYDDHVDNVLMLDMDIYKDQKQEYNFSSTIHDFLEYSRIKAVKLRDELFKIEG